MKTIILKKMVPLFLQGETWRWKEQKGMKMKDDEHFNNES